MIKSIFHCNKGTKFGAERKRRNVITACQSSARETHYVTQNNHLVQLRYMEIFNVEFCCNLFRFYDLFIKHPSHVKSEK